GHCRYCHILLCSNS
nr:immunoglobulin heavy chain junction region [Mus musculus]